MPLNLSTYNTSPSTSNNTAMTSASSFLASINANLNNRINIMSSSTTRRTPYRASVSPIRHNSSSSRPPSSSPGRMRTLSPAYRLPQFRREGSATSMASTASTKGTGISGGLLYKPAALVRPNVKNSYLTVNNNNLNYANNNLIGSSSNSAQVVPPYRLAHSMSSMSGVSSAHARRSYTRSPSPALVRRMYPQPARDGSTFSNTSDYYTKDPSPVVIDANLSFILSSAASTSGGGSTGRCRVRQTLSPIPAHLEDSTASAYLTNKIADFLTRTDHVMDEWRRVGGSANGRRRCGSLMAGGGDDMDEYYAAAGLAGRLGRSRSANNIRIRGFQYYSRASSVATSVSQRSSLARDTSIDCCTELDEVSEITADLADEHSAATLASERLESESTDRVRLERELCETQLRNERLERSGERLEMELLYARADLNGGSTGGAGSIISDSDYAGDVGDDDGGGDGDGYYKERYQRALRELQFTKRRLQQQHEDDLEQLVGLKKQLEKKLTDAYEEVNEQRQVVGQWKRKVQKITGELTDVKLMLESQMARNSLLEKKQRKFDGELQMLNDELRQERQQRERLGREKESALTQQISLEAELADVKHDLDVREEKVRELQRELESSGGIGSGGLAGEDEVTTLRRVKQEQDRRLQDQEQELDDLAGQLQIVEQAKLRLEMTLEQMRKAAKREAAQHDEELEEARCSAQKKCKLLEQQLESEHEERTALLRDKHELERRLAAVGDRQREDRSRDEMQSVRLKRDLKRTKALLRDAHVQLEKLRNTDTPQKALVRQLRNQLEDAECARGVAVKGRQTAESELLETQALLDEAQRMRRDAEESLSVSQRERAVALAQLEENEDEMGTLMSRYRTVVGQQGRDQAALREQVVLVAELESERSALQDQVAETTARLEAAERTLAVLSGSSAGGMGVDSGVSGVSGSVSRLELRIKELEGKLDLEQTTKGRLEVQINRLKENIERSHSDCAAYKSKEQQAQDGLRKLQRTMREIREDHANVVSREAESVLRRKDAEQRCETLESESATARADLRLALKRIEDLQAAMQGDLDDSDDSDGGHSSNHSELDYSSDDSVGTFLANHASAGATNSSSSTATTVTAAPSTSSNASSVAHRLKTQLATTAGSASASPSSALNSSTNNGR